MDEGSKEFTKTHLLASVDGKRTVLLDSRVRLSQMLNYRLKLTWPN